MLSLYLFHILDYDFFSLKVEWVFCEESLHSFITSIDRLDGNVKYYLMSRWPIYIDVEIRPYITLNTITISYYYSSNDHRVNFKSLYLF